MSLFTPCGGGWGLFKCLDFGFPHWELCLDLLELYECLANPLSRLPFKKMLFHVTVHFQYRIAKGQARSSQ